MDCRECRICLESDEQEMISPCLCKGTSKWVHRQCLDTWRVMDDRYGTFHTCPTCKFNYEFENQVEWHLFFKMAALFLIHMLFEVCVVVAFSAAFVCVITLIIQVRTDSAFVDTIPLGINTTFVIMGVMGFIHVAMTIGSVRLFCDLLSSTRGKSSLTDIAQGLLFILGVVGVIVAVFISLSFLIDRARLHWQREWRSKIVDKYVVKHI